MAKHTYWAAGVAGALALAACGSQEPASTISHPLAKVGTDENWEATGGQADESGFSRLTQINTKSVGKLGLAWSLDLPGEVTLEATPLAVDGILYFTGGAAAVYAVEAASGKLLWKFDPETWARDPALSTFRANRGVAYENGRIFVAELDGRLNALDAKTGEVIWSADSIPDGMGNYSTGAPRTMNGKVIIGNGGADFGMRGFVTAFDAATGKQLWRFFTVPGSPDQNKGDAVMEKAAATWRGEYWKTGTGGTVWNGITFDPDLNQVYIGVGNAGPYDPEVRSPGGGDNLYTTSIVALDATTGKYVWHYQQNPRDAWDYKATPNIITSTLKLDGVERKVLMHAPTNGFFYVIDRTNGKLISTGKTTVITWAKDIDLETGRPIEEPNIRYENGRTEIWPGTIGGHNWQAMSYSPNSGLVYIPVMQLGARFTKNQKDIDDKSFNIFGLKFEPVASKPGDGKGTLVAWDPVAQKAAWKVQHETLWNGGTLATAGNLVFQGTADGQFRAWNAQSGDQLWRFDAKLGIISAPMSFSHKGEQYVAVLVGYGGTTAVFSEFMDMGWKYGAQPRRVLAFKLGGKAKLPETAPADKKLYPVDDPALVLNEADVAAGRALSIRCAACHGMGMSGAGSPGPDLRESQIALQLDTFSQYVRAGRLDMGMPQFPDLTDAQVRQLHSYIRARSREELGLRKPDADQSHAAQM